MTAVVYAEGGGDSKASRAECRKGFARFFTNAGLKGRMPKIFACGGREQAYRDFCHALGKPKNDRFTVLLVDSEDLVEKGMGPWEHLKRRDHWEKPAAATDENAHLMVQCMEAWFLADKDCLADFFGHGFSRNALPRNQDIEQVAKNDLLDRLKAATRRCRPKGEYGKGRHSFEILSAIDPTKVLAASPHAKRMIDTLRAKA